MSETRRTRVLRRSRAPVHLSLAVAAAIGPVSAYAQSSSPFLQGDIPFEYDRGRNTSVLERDRPDYAASGIPTGGFTFYPSTDLGLGYDSNVYNQPTNATQDAYFDIRPDARLTSNWSRNRLEVQAGARLRRYVEETIRNEDGYYARLSGRADLGLDSFVQAAGSIERLYEPRLSPTAVRNVASSVPYRRIEGRLLAQTSLSRTRLAGQFEYSNYDFSTVTDLNGAEISQQSRDRNRIGITGLAEFALTPDTAVYAQATYEAIDYRIGLPSGLPNRDSKGFRALAGVSFDITAVARGRIGAGYTRRNYDAASYADVGGLSILGSLEYFPSQLITVTATAQRRIDDASIVGASGYVSTSGSLSVDYELLRNLLLNSRVDYEHGDYKGVNADTDIFRVGGSARYLVSRSAALGFSLAYSDRQNSGVPTGPEFSETRAMLTLSLQK